MFSLGDLAYTQTASLRTQGLLNVEGLPDRADTHACITIVLGLTKSHFESGVSALTGLGYRSFYIQQSLLKPYPCRQANTVSSDYRPTYLLNVYNALAKTCSVQIRIKLRQLFLLRVRLI